MKMLLEDAQRVVDLCKRMRRMTSNDERIKLAVAVMREWHKVSEPLVFAAEDAVYFVMFGQERDGAAPLEALSALASAEADVYVPPPEDSEDASPTES